MAELNEPKSSEEILESYPAIKDHVSTSEEREYVDGIVSQHFVSKTDPDTRTMGSCFYKESCPDAMHALELIADKLESGDDSADREFFQSQGTPASALAPFAKYYKVPVQGKSKIVSVAELPDEQMVELKPSPKGTPSLVITEADAPQSALEDVNYGTVITGPRDFNDPDKGHTIWTMHAGYPINPVPIEKGADGQPVRDSEGRMIIISSTGWKYGDKISVSEVKQNLGEETFISIE
ncbi:hypothetical protein GF354_03780 [Candidatus Peregrinibacteria bacterium]|nr:hypothetical protein [Candidatus Peregrinibacteria bacterium]